MPLMLQHVSCLQQRTLSVSMSVSLTEGLFGDGRAAGTKHHHKVTDHLLYAQRCGATPSSETGGPCAAATSLDRHYL